MHGFLNVLGAGVLAHARGLDEARLGEILRDENPAHFRFTDADLAWLDFTASVPEITAARQWILSFGSCSFDEPRDDLRDLHLLEGSTA
jgi:hypothetical protein